jgi:hypothetical protein
METAPLAGRDTKAAYTGLVIGFIAVAIVVVSIIYLTNRSFAGHETPAAAQPH